MNKFYPLQESFEFGEISPLLISRSGTQEYQKGCKQLKNMISRSQGPAQTRPGFVVLDVTDDVETCRLVAFKTRDNVTFGARITETDIRILTAEGEPRQDRILNPNFDLFGDDWTVFEPAQGIVTFSGGQCQLETGNNVGTYIEQQSQPGTAGATFRLVVSAFNAGDTGTIEAWVGTAQGLSDLVNINVAPPGVVLDFVPPGTQFWVRVTLTTLTSSVHLDVVSASEPATSFPSFPSPWTAAQLRTMQWIVMPSGNDVVLVQGEIPPQSLKVTGGVWSFTPVVFVSPPAEWVGNNWPRTVEIFKGRTYWGGTLGTPETFWASKSGEYFDLTIGTVADDAFTHTLTQRGEIRWIRATRGLIMGTEYGEWLITSESTADDLLAPGQVVANQQSAFGSNRAQAIRVGNTVMFVTTDNKKVRISNYVWDDDAWVSTDVTFLSEHITGPGLSHLAFVQNPYSLLYFVDTTGVLITMNYEPTLKIKGWQRHPSWGNIQDVIGVDGALTGQSFAVIARIATVDGVQRLYVEVSDDAAVQDTRILQESQTPVLTLGGFDSLIGEEVSLLVDKAVHPNVVVDPSGFVTTQWPGERFEVGKAFLQTLETLPEIASGATGTTSSWMKRWNRIYLRVLASYAPIINGTRPPTRFPSDPMNEIDPPRTGNIKVSDLGWDRDASILIEQDLPLKLTVTGIFGALGGSGL